MPTGCSPPGCTGWPSPRARPSKPAGTPGCGRRAGALLPVRPGPEQFLPAGEDSGHLRSDHVHVAAPMDDVPPRAEFRRPERVGGAGRNKPRLTPSQRGCELPPVLRDHWRIVHSEALRSPNEKVEHRQTTGSASPRGSIRRLIERLVRPVVCAMPSLQWSSRSTKTRPPQGP